MNVRAGLVLAVALLAAPVAWAQEPLPPLQPPYPLAPPPSPRMFSPLIIGDSFEAQIAGEDVVAALSVRGLFRFQGESSWSNKPYACIAADRSDYACVQAELKARQDEDERPFGVVLLHGRLSDGRLAWDCVGAAGAVAVEIDLETFFAVDLKVRNAERNKALACMEKAAGYDDWQTLHSLL